MSGKVIFALTETQAAALVAIKLGARVPADSPSARLRLLECLKGKKLLNGASTAAGAPVLTELGESAVDLCARLALGIGR